MTRLGWTVVSILAVIIVVLAIALFALPAPDSPTSPTPPTPAPTPSPAAFTSENVRVFSPVPGAAVSRQFTVLGEARGSWFFEASFPIKVVDANNNQVGTGIAMTADNWMTTEFVPFSAQVTVENYSGPATIVLLKDNPSGLPELEDSVSYDIVVE